MTFTFPLFSFVGGIGTKKASLAVEENLRGKTDIFFPKSIKGKIPLIISLHGYRGNQKLQEVLAPMRKYVARKGFVLAVPNGLINSEGQRYWNAHEACCDFDRKGHDDVAFIKNLIYETAKRYPIDLKRVYLFGHSNGGFMSHKIACEAGGLIKGIASWAGSSPSTMKSCKSPVSVLQIHGTSDKTILYEGGDIVGFKYPSAEAIVNNWAQFNQCNPKMISSSKQRGALAGFYRTLYQKTWSQCKQGSKVTLWKANRGKHVSLLGLPFTEKIIDHLLSM